MQDQKSLLPKEFLEPNLRLYSFIVLLGVALFALIEFPVKPFQGYIDPFYSPTILIIPIIALFRLTCYAFREDTNRHVFSHPNACAASIRLDAKAREYTGENSTIFKIENLHRYFMYGALVILPFFYYDLYVSLTYTGALLLRLGSVIMAIDIAALTLYLFSCHSVRSLIGGRSDCFNCMRMGRQRNWLYNVQSKLNQNHEAYAWISLVTIVFMDLFIRALIAGIHLDFVIVHAL